MFEKLIVPFIGGHEGKVLHWYLDPTGTPTIGYGFTWASRIFREWWMAKHGRKFRRGDTMTGTEALYVLKIMLAEEYWPPVDRQFKNQLVRVKSAGLSFVYNGGAGVLNWKWAAAIMRGDLKEGCRLWRVTATTSRGKRLPGLIRRRAEEAGIAEFGRWPSWVKPLGAGEVVQTRVISDDIRQAQIWLNKLGYNSGSADGLTGPRTIAAIKRFQRDHGTLAVDGLIGPATLSGLQRAIDVQAKAAKSTGGGAVVATGGAAENATDTAEQLHPMLDQLGDYLLWGGVAISILSLAWLGWHYRYELKTLVRKL